jgi:hypothetical protein
VQVPHSAAPLAADAPAPVPAPPEPEAAAQALPSHDQQLERLPQALVELWEACNETYRNLHTRNSEGDIGVAGFWEHRRSKLHREFRHPNGLLHLHTHLYGHHCCNRIAEVMYELAKDNLSLVSCASSGLEALNKVSHKVWGTILCNGGIKPKDRLLFYFLNMALIINVQREILLDEREQELAAGAEAVCSDQLS